MSTTLSRFEGQGVVVTLVSVDDSIHPYEVGISHSRFNKGGWICAGTYVSEEAAYEGYEYWISTMTARSLPTCITDVSRCTFKTKEGLLNIPFYIDG
jgi:hypothetical protein